jgi:hypothetical protein
MVGLHKIILTAFPNISTALAILSTSTTDTTLLPPTCKVGFYENLFSFYCCPLEIDRLLQVFINAPILSASTTALILNLEYFETPNDNKELSCFMTPAQQPDCRLGLTVMVGRLLQVSSHKQLLYWIFYGSNFSYVGLWQFIFMCVSCGSPM